MGRPTPAGVRLVMQMLVRSLAAASIRRGSMRREKQQANSHRGADQNEENSNAPHHLHGESFPSAAFGTRNASRMY